MVQAGGPGQGGGREGGPWAPLGCEGGSLPLCGGEAGVCLLPYFHGSSELLSEGFTT